MTNPIRWWLQLAVYAYLWWTRERKKHVRPKPNTEPRCARGHLKRRRENGRWKDDHDCSGWE